MKNIVLLLSMVALLTSCTSNNDDEQGKIVDLQQLESVAEMNYEQSLSSWADLKSKNGNSYIYQTAFTSWTGNGSTTQIRVKNGVVIERFYEAFTIKRTEAAQTKTVHTTYFEDEKNLGSHQEGDATITIDEIYAICAKDYLITDNINNYITFTTANNGLLTSCGYTPKNCADDCFIGLSISAFNWTK